MPDDRPSSEAAPVDGRNITQRVVLNLWLLRHTERGLRRGGGGLHRKGCPARRPRVTDFEGLLLTLEVAQDPRLVFRGLRFGDVALSLLFEGAYLRFEVQLRRPRLVFSTGDFPLQCLFLRLVLPRRPRRQAPA